MAAKGNGNDPSLEDQVAMLKEQLAEAQKMTALGELLSTTTHEFNNVLMTVINYAKMGLRHKDEATRDKALTKILAAGERASKITNSVLGRARNRSAGREATDIATLVVESLVLLEREMNKYRISIEKQFESVPPADVNANQIQQILLNLLINARQAMPGGGTIVLGLAYDREAETVDLKVRDTGTGIPQDKLSKIFDPFFSTKQGPDESGKGGTGLGLSSSRDIIQAHGGRIRVETTVGKGTAFTVKLPAVRSTSGVPAPAASAAAGTNVPASN